MPIRIGMTALSEEPDVCWDTQEMLPLVSVICELADDSVALVATEFGLVVLVSTVDDFNGK
jgi:hypothetical protein